MEILSSLSPSLLSFKSENSKTMTIQSTFDLGLESVAITNDRISLTYSDGSTSNLRKHLKYCNHINKVPELNIKKKSTDMLKNEQTQSTIFLVEDNGFKSIILYLEPEAKEVPEGVSLTTDIWTTSTYEKSFM
ncbi:2897_t:CDS:2, partial [Cetraspora pellucida]